MRMNSEERSLRRRHLFRLWKELENTNSAAVYQLRPDMRIATIGEGQDYMAPVGADTGRSVRTVNIPM